VEGGWGDETRVGESSEEMKWIYIGERELYSSFIGGTCSLARLRDGLASQAHGIEGLTVAYERIRGLSRSCHRPSGRLTGRRPAFVEPAFGAWPGSKHAKPAVRRRATVLRGRGRWGVLGGGGCFWMGRGEGDWEVDGGGGLGFVAGCGGRPSGGWMGGRDACG